MPRATRSCFTDSETATSASAAVASRVSSRRKRAVFAGEKYPRSTWPWYVCTTVGTPAARAASRPRTPALAVWVWTIAGRHARMRR